MKQKVRRAALKESGFPMENKSLLRMIVFPAFERISYWRINRTAYQ
jgi:hypothetical protein